MILISLFGSVERPKSEEQLITEQYDRAATEQLQQAALNPEGEETFLSNSENRSDLIRWQQDLDDDLIFLIQSLTGKKLTSNGWVSVEGSKAMCNDKFIEEVIIPQCKPFLSNNMINTNFDTKNIFVMLRNTCNEITDAMADNFDRYDIEFNNRT